MYFVMGYFHYHSDPWPIPRKGNRRGGEVIMSSDNSTYWSTMIHKWTTHRGGGATGIKVAWPLGYIRYHSGPFPEKGKGGVPSVYVQCSQILLVSYDMQMNYTQWVRGRGSLWLYSLSSGPLALGFPPDSIDRHLVLSTSHRSVCCCGSNLFTIEMDYRNQYSIPHVTLMGY